MLQKQFIIYIYIYLNRIMTQEIQAIRLDIQDIGKHVKASKKRFSWTFGLNGRHHTIMLDFSFISGKVKLVVDRKTMLQSQLPTGSSFQHPFTLDGYALNILQQGQTFQLRINNKVFSHLYNQAKTNTEFKNYQDEVKDIKVNESQFQNSSKTVKLNIGALDGKKKTKQNVQTENWGNFGGSEMGIPSYFGDSSPTKLQKKQVVKTKSLLDEQGSQATDVSVQKKKEQAVKKNKSQEIDFFAENTQPATTLTSPSQEHLSSIINQQQKSKQQFNTMQQLFSTMNINNPPQPQIPQQKQQSGLDLLNTVTNSSKAQPNASSEFNTMQNLFATSNVQNTGVHPIFNLNTNQDISSTSNPIVNTNPVGDFNAIQTLYASNTQNMTSIPVNNPNTAYQTANNNNFYSMYNLFATGNNQGISPQNPSLSSNPTFPTNTSQNLFATSSNMPTSQMANQSNITLNSNVQDFNTMQNLFKTSGGLNFPPPSAPVTTTTSNSATVDPFSLIGLTSTTPNTNLSGNNTAMFNTYSGVSSTTSGKIDAANFGTMQQNTGGAVDFFNLASQNKATQVPNFTKKKQPSNDLI